MGAFFSARKGWEGRLSMSDETTVEQAEDQVSEPATGDEATEEVSELEQAKRHSRKWEDRAKANHRDLETVRGDLDSVTRERDGLAEKLEAVQAERDSVVAEREHQVLIKRVADEEDVDPSLVRGSTEEELRDHAKAIKKAVTPVQPRVTGYADTSEKSKDEMSDFLNGLFS